MTDPNIIDKQPSLANLVRLHQLKEQMRLLEQNGGSDLLTTLQIQAEELSKPSDKDHVSEIEEIITDNPRLQGNNFSTEEKLIIDEWIKEMTEKLPNLTEREINGIQMILAKSLGHDYDASNASISGRSRINLNYTLKETSKLLCTEEFLSCLNINFLKQYCMKLRYNSDKRENLQTATTELRKKLGDTPEFWIPYFAYFTGGDFFPGMRDMMRSIITSEVLINYFEEKSKVEKFDRKEDEEIIKNIKFYLQLCREGTLNIKIPWKTFKNLHEKLFDAGEWNCFNIGDTNHSITGDIWDPNIISDQEELKKELEDSLKEGRLIYKYLFGNYIWRLIDKSFQVPSYINRYIDRLGDSHKGVPNKCVPNGLRLVESYAASLKPDETGEKFSGKVLDHTDYNSDYSLCHRDQFAIWENPELLRVLDVESLESSFFPLWFYLYLKHNTDIDVSGLVGKVFESGDFMNFWYKDRVQKNYNYKPPYNERGKLKHSIKYADFQKYGGVPSDIKEKYSQTDAPTRFTEFMQDVYATENPKYLDNLYVYCFISKKGFDQCSDEDKDVLIRKVLNSSIIKTPSDCENFLFAISHTDKISYYESKVHEYSIKISNNTPLAMMIYYVITGDISWTTDYLDKNLNVPQSIYRKVCENAIAQGESIPIKWKAVPDPLIEEESIKDLRTLYEQLQSKKKEEYEEQQARKQRLQEIENERRKRQLELEEIKEYAVKNWEEGNVILDYRKQTNFDKGQKFILIVDPHTKQLLFISEDLNFHSEIKEKYCPDGQCLGGGRIFIDDDGVYHVYGRSESYGYVAGEDKKAMENLLRKEFPDKTFKFYQ